MSAPGRVDFLVLGGGSAGCALAARLSEDASRQVVLVEAGRDLRADTMPAAIRTRYPGHAYLDPQNLWPDLSAIASGAPSRMPNREPRRYEQARVLGGGSVINAMVANRGAPDDYDEWARLGARGWSGEVAMRYFRKLERDCDIDDEHHGRDGPIPVRRLAQPRVSPFVRAVCATLAARGLPMQPDQNGAWRDGVFPACVSTSDEGHRVPASIAYLTPEVRARANLRIRTDTHVQTLLFDGPAPRVIGAEVDGPGGLEQLHADETFVCLGGIHSAALLLRSGIGPGADLAALGIVPRRELPGVGRNLMDHPLVALSAYLPPASRQRDLDEHHDQALLRYTSTSIPDAPAGDMHVAMLARTAWHAVGQRMGTLLIWVNKPYSRGLVTLRAADPHVEPMVDFRLLSDERDALRLNEGFRRGADILLDPRLEGARGCVFPTSYSERVRKVSAAGRWNAWQMAAFGRMLDWAGPAREALVHGAITNGTRLDRLLADDDALTEHIGRNVAGVWHASGTCRMGASGDPSAVTDGAGRVHGVHGLRVCDSSIMPAIPRANTNLPTLMLAERIADLVKGGA